MRELNRGTETQTQGERDLDRATEIETPEKRGQRWEGGRKRDTET